MCKKRQNGDNYLINRSLERPPIKQDVVLGCHLNRNVNGWMWIMCFQVRMKMIYCQQLAVSLQHKVL